MPGGSDDRVRVVQQDLSAFGGALPVNPSTTTPVHILDNVSTDYDGTPSTAQSSWFAIGGSQSITLELNILKTLVPTSIALNLLTADSDSPTTNGELEYDWWGDLIYPQASIPAGAVGRKPALTAFNLKAPFVALLVTALGVSATNKFHIVGAKIYY